MKGQCGAAAGTKQREEMGAPMEEKGQELLKLILQPGAKVEEENLGFVHGLTESK